MSEATQAPLRASTDRASTENLSKGEKTRQRLLDAAEQLFASKGYDGCSLREVASAAGIREPGIYNYFKSKDALYTEVLDRAVKPMVATIEQNLKNRGTGNTGTEPGSTGIEIAERIFDLMREHPAIPALFYQALNKANDANQPDSSAWLESLFGMGLKLQRRTDIDSPSRYRAANRMVALFNISTGYFLSQKLFDQMDAGNLLDEANVLEQKKLLGKVIQLFLSEE